MNYRKLNSKLKKHNLKVCGVCDERKSLSEFYIKQRTEKSIYYCFRCKSCQNIYSCRYRKKRYSEDTDYKNRIISSVLGYNERNKELVHERKMRYKRNRYRTDEDYREKVKEEARLRYYEKKRK